MGPDLEKSKVTVGVLTNKDQEDKQLLPCVNNYEDNNFNEEADLNSVSINEDMEVNIIECTKSAGDDGQAEARSCEEENVTESMSSFGDTSSENEIDSSLLGENEVNSRSHMSLPIFNEYDGGELLMRKKKLTNHWRRFIRPLMWRCKWIELQIREFRSQAFRYDRELAKHAQRKQIDIDTFVLEGLDTKSLPFSSCTRRNKVKKRKKRKRVEEMTDSKSYMLHHNLFSYYENRKSAANGTSLNGDCDNPGNIIDTNDDFGFQDGWTLESKGEDNIQENILWKIEVLQLKVRKLKARIDKVLSENPGKFSSVNMLSMPASGDALTSPDQNLAVPPEDSDQMRARSLYTLSQRLSDFNTGDIIPDSVVSSPGEVTPLPDMSESAGQLLVGMMGKNDEDGRSTHNQALKQEMQDFKNIKVEHTEKSPALMEKRTAQASETDKLMETFVPRVNYGGKTLPKSRSNVSNNNKRKRGRRKSRRGGWNRKS